MKEEIAFWVGLMIVAVLMPQLYIALGISGLPMLILCGLTGLAYALGFEYVKGLFTDGE